MTNSTILAVKVSFRPGCTPRIDNREIKLDVTWSFVKWQMAKKKLLPSVFSSLNSRVKVFIFVVNSWRHLSIFM